MLSLIRQADWTRWRTSTGRESETSEFARSLYGLFLTSRQQRKRTKPRDSTNAQGETAADSTTQLFAKKRFSKKINYAAIEDLFADKGQETSNGEVFGDQSPYRARSESVVPGTPIYVPAPTFAGSRQGTPVSRRTASLAPTGEPSGSSGGFAAPTPKKKVVEAAEGNIDWLRDMNGKGADDEDEVEEDMGYGDEA